VYATIPVISLGRTLLQDLYASTPLAASIIPTESLSESAYAYPSALPSGSNPNILLQAPTHDEIANYFGLIDPLKYSQPRQPQASPSSPPLNGLTITAYSAGHTLGGTIWHIQHGMESVVYAVDWNQAREHVLSGAAWLGGPGTGGSEVLEQLRRPTALICSSKGSGKHTNTKGNQRDEALLSAIRDTIAKGGSVLIPSDSSARILELSYLLEETWQNEASRADSSSPLKNAKLYLASRTGGATMRYVRSMVEWMDEGIVKEFGAGATDGQEQGRGRTGGKDDRGARPPFDFRHITLLERKTRVTRMLGDNEPRVILASDTSLEWGFSKDAIRSLASDEKNLIILTERVGELSRQEKGLGRYLWELWHQRNASNESATIIEAPGQASMRVARTVALEGDEVPLYQHHLARQRQLHNTMGGDATTNMETADVVDDRSSTTSESSEDSEDMVHPHQGKALNTTATLRHARNKVDQTDAEMGVNVLTRRKNVHDFEVQGKKGADKMFPIMTRRRRADDFGELIRPEEFARAEEEDNVPGEPSRADAAKKENTVGQKRKWDGMADAPAEPDSEPEDDPDKVDGPAKVVIGSETIDIRCRITYIDFSGLHDRRTIQTLVPLIKPRNLIFIAGEETETKDLAEELRKTLASIEAGSSIDVFTPAVGVMIDASVDTNAWSVKLSRSMIQHLRWQKVHGLGVVAITGRLQAASLEPPPKEEEDETPAKKRARLEATPAIPVSQEANDDTPVLDMIPTNMATAVRSVAQPFHVGDLRLADLRKLMKASGMEAEFRGEGILVVNGTVAVRKTAGGTIEVDGGAYSFNDPRSSDAATFFTVKRKIYEGLAVVAGS
jgi:cleavage and polyadenylation specificity factor subunit 2